MGICGVEDQFRPKMLCQCAFGFSRPGADDARAKLLRYLNGSRANPARAADDKHPIAPTDRCAIGEHMHRRAAGKRERSRRVEIDAFRDADKRASRDENFFGETAITIDPQQLAKQTKRLLAASTEFAFAAEKVGLDCDLITGAPVINIAANCEDATRDFAAERAGKLNWNRQAGGFSPQIDMVQPAALHLNNRFIRAWNRIGNFAQLEFTG